MIRSGATIESVLKEFVTCFTGSLRDWFDSLGPYRQLQFVQLSNVSSALTITHEQFIREPYVVFEVTRRDYLNMKCCSLNTKDLDFHYKRISIMFYKLNGYNNHTLKHVFMASLLITLGNKSYYINSGLELRSLKEQIRCFYYILVTFCINIHCS